MVRAGLAWAFTRFSDDYAAIEAEVNGVERMLYMSSKCTNDGQMMLDVTFELGTNLDTAQVLVQNRVSIAQAKLPDEVKRIGVTTKKKSPSILLCINLLSEKEPDPDGEDQVELPGAQVEVLEVAVVGA